MKRTLSLLLASVDNPKPLLSALLALGCAAILSAFSSHFLDAERLANLDLSHSGVSSLYIQMHPSRVGYCYVTNRRDSTIRRADDPTRGRRWEFQRSAGQEEPSGLAHWLLRSKSDSTFVLIPVRDVPDWAYPYLYQFLAEQDVSSTLPPVKWVQLFVNRIYQGLFLKVELPAEPRRNPGGNGSRRELLMLSRTTVACSDSRLRGRCTVYPDLIANGRFPALTTPAAQLTFLRSRSPVQESLFMMQPVQPYEATYLPLPIALRHEYELVTQEPLPTTLDDRFRSWVQLPSSEVPQLADILSPQQLRTLRRGWDSYRTRLLRALEAHCAYHQCARGLRTHIQRRLDASWADILDAKGSSL